MMDVEVFDELKELYGGKYLLRNGMVVEAYPAALRGQSGEDIVIGKVKVISMPEGLFSGVIHEVQLVPDNRLENASDPLNWIGTAHGDGFDVIRRYQE